MTSYTCFSRVALLVGLVTLLPHSVAAQITTGNIDGVVTDSSGATLPGVTVTASSDRLIGGTKTSVTDGSGRYRFERLDPGVYAIRFELQGFKSAERREIRLSATFTATVNEKLEIGQLEETVTVTGESPVVDTKSNVQQTVMNQEVLEGIPSGRDVWALGKLIPGVAINNYDVGGTQGMQQSSMSSHGSSTNDQTFAIDGLSVNWSGGGGGATMVYYDQGMFEEVNYQTSAIPAEVAIGGIFMNMVTKAGGNVWKSDARFYLANDRMQAKNFESVSKQFGTPVGNPIIQQYDFNAQASGPILKDKIWFFGSFRSWKVDKRLLASFNSDGTNGIDDNLILNGSAKLTGQLSASHRLGVVYNFNQKNRYHRRDGASTFQDDKATVVQLQPGYTGNIKYTGVFGASVFESTFGGVSGVWPLHYQKEVKPTDVHRQDDILSTSWEAASRSYDNPNYRMQFDNVYSRSIAAGSSMHNLKVGLQLTRQMYKDVNTANYDMGLNYNNGVPYRVTVWNTPVIALSFLHQYGFFMQDSWTIANRLTLNLGARFDKSVGWYPAQESPAGTWVPARSIQKKEVFNRWRPVWRTGVVFDVKGDGQTAIKGNFSRYAGQLGAANQVNTVHPFARSSANVAWTDANRDQWPQASELGRFEGFTGGATTVYADANGPAWPYSQEITAGIEHQLVKDLRVSLMYYNRRNVGSDASFNLSVPSSAYTPVTIANPLGGTVTFYNLNPSYVGLQNNVRSVTSLVDTKYSGVEFTAVKSFSKRWMMLFGLTRGKNEGGQTIGSDFNDPNNLINQQGVTSNDQPWQVRLSGTFQLPGDISLSGSFIRNSGYPYQKTYSISRSVYPGLIRSSQSIRLTAMGDERYPSVQMADVRISRAFRFGGNRSFEPQFDIFNATNADTVVSQVNTIGAKLGWPSEILAPRLFRVGFVVKF